MIVTCIWSIAWIANATDTAAEVVDIIDFSEVVVFDAFNDSYLSSLDYRGLLLHHDQEPSKFTTIFYCLADVDRKKHFLGKV
jgi:hypothetical protein